MMSFDECARAIDKATIPSKDRVCIVSRKSYRALQWLWLRDMIRLYRMKKRNQRKFRK